MIKAIGFDVGGTLVRLQGPGLSVRISRLLDLPVSDFRDSLDRCYRTKRRDFDTCTRAFASEMSIDPDWLTRNLTMSTEEPALYDDVLDCLASLHQYELFVMSNASPWEASSLDILGVRHFLKHSQYSFECGFTKPDERAFLQMEASLGLSGSSILYVGDSWRSDIVGPANRGWNTCYLDRGQRTSTDPDQRIMPPPDAILRSLAELPEAIKLIAERSES